MKDFVKKYAYNKYSQNGEDGVLEEILKRLGITSGTFCEFGAADGIFMSNTRLLLENGWTGFYIEEDAALYDKLIANVTGFAGGVNCKCLHLTPENINGAVPQTLDVLSMDTEGMDYALWQAYTGKAKVVIIEINGSYGFGEHVIHSDANPHGSSYNAMVELGHAKGYHLICSTGNLIFVSGQVMSREAFPEIIAAKTGKTREDWMFEFFNDSWLENASITHERWLEAQVSEKEMHDRVGFDEGMAQWGRDYRIYFQHLGMTFHQADKVIIEVGCAGFPALHFCDSYRRGILVEPMPTDNLNRIVAMHERLEVVQAKFEEAELPQADEIWLFNVMQHIQDPNLFLRKCKKLARVIRFFEPVNWPTCVFHPHTFKPDYFKRQLGEEVVRQYIGGSIAGFHEAECVYGAWFNTKDYDKAKKIGILTTATWKFKDFVPQFLEGVQRFLPGYAKTVFLFHDSDNDLGADVQIRIPHKPFPRITLERYHRYLQHADAFKDMDYLFHLDIDMGIMECGEEILKPLVAVQHPYFYLGGGSWEDNPASAAYVPPEGRRYYVCGGVQGGERELYLTAAESMKEKIDADDGHHITAKWHDESYWNKIFSSFVHVELLNPSYCYSEGRGPIPFFKKIVALDKDRSAYRD